MSLNTLQKVILAVGSLLLAGSLLWVPHQAVLAREGDNLTRFVGYAPVFAPPQTEGCKQAFPTIWPLRRLTMCTVQVQGDRVLMTAGAVAAGTVALVLLAGLLGPSRTAVAPRKHDMPLPRTGTLAEALRQARPDLGLGAGDSTEASPLVITEARDYVAVEYAAAHWLMQMAGLEYKLTRQGVEDRGRTTVDVLIFDTKPIGAADWTGRRSYFFDVTAGYTRRGMT